VPKGKRESVSEAPRDLSVLEVPDDMDENEVPKSWTQGSPIRPSSLSRSLNDRRYWLTCMLLALMAILAVVSLALLWLLPSDRLDRLRELLIGVYAPIVTLVSTSFGWFFAAGGRPSGLSRDREIS
jgi:hypothetical protein